MQAVPDNESYLDVHKYIEEVTSDVDESLFLNIVNTSSGMGIVEIKKALADARTVNSQAYIVRLLEIPTIRNSGKFGRFIQSSEGGVNQFSPALFKAMAKAKFYYKLDGNNKLQFFGFNLDELLQLTESFEEF